jgi:hypothetical protein
MRVGLSCHLDQALVGIRGGEKPVELLSTGQPRAAVPPAHLRRNKEWNNAGPGW